MDEKSQLRCLYMAYWLALFLQMGIVMKTTQYAEVMHTAWSSHHDLLLHSTPKTVLSWPFKGAVRAFILSHECEDVKERKAEILREALRNNESDSCLVIPVQNETEDYSHWFYWSPSEAQEHQLTKENKESEFDLNFERKLQGRHLQESLERAREFYRNVEDNFQTALRIARHVGSARSGRNVIFVDRCQQDRIVFGEVGLTAKYLNLIFLSTFAKDFQNDLEELGTEGCLAAVNNSFAEDGAWDTWCQLSKPEPKDWSEKRRGDYNMLFVCLVTCLAVKLVISKIQSCMEYVSDRFAGQRSRCDRRWESTFVEVYALILFICLQSTLSTMFLLVWRPNCALATNIPAFGLVFCVGLFVAVCVLNEIDKFTNWTGRWESCQMVIFWCLSVVFLICVTIPLCTLTFYNLQFFFQVWNCQIRKQHTSYIPFAMKEASRWCSRFTLGFMILSLIEFGLLFWMDQIETERERRPQTLPFKTKGDQGYNLVNSKS